MALFAGVITASFLLTAGCELSDPDHPRLDVAQPNGGGTFANYVALGNSLTAGFMDGGLHINGQRGSYPALIAGAMGFDIDRDSPDYDWIQPFVADPGLGSSSTDDPDSIAGVLYWDISGGIEVTGPTHVDAAEDLALDMAHPRPYHNLAVPGATLSDVLEALDGETAALEDNRLFELVLRNPAFGNTTMLEQCIGSGPTLITLWIGNNDVLLAATEGDPVLGDDVTAPHEFRALYEELVDALLTGVRARTGFDPVIIAANIPSVPTIPYFLDVTRYEILAGGDVAYEEEDVTYVRFPALELEDPEILTSDYTLSAAEVAMLDQASAAYSEHIETICAARGIRCIDMRSHLRNLQESGIEGLTGDHPIFDPMNSAFSLDGIHPNNRGYGAVANFFIEAINEVLASELERVEVASLFWDPTYGRMPIGLAGKECPADQGSGASLTSLGWPATDQRPRISPAAARVLNSLFR